MDQGLCSNGPKAEFVLRIHNYIGIIRESKRLPVDNADVAHVCRRFYQMMLILMDQMPFVLYV